MTGDTVNELVEFYYRYLGRNGGLEAHFDLFKNRYKSDPKAAIAEAVVFSLLWAEGLQPELFEDVSKGGPDFCIKSSPSETFLVEVTSLDSAMVSKRSGLPSSITRHGGGAFGLITDRLLSEAKNKAPQLGLHHLPGVLAITSDHAFASILLDGLAAEYLMTSAPQFNAPLDGRPTFTSTDLRHSVFYKPLRVVDTNGAPIIEPCRQSIAAILLMAIDAREVQVVGLLHPEAIYPFAPGWLPKVPFVKFRGQVSPTNIDTEWIQADASDRVATFPHRHIQ
jgi:hypothetical protein